MKYFSATTRGFYDDVMHGARLREVVGEEGENEGWEPNPDCLMPPDVVEVSDEEYAELFAHGGARIGVDENGRPVVEAAHVETHAQAVARMWEAIQAERDRRTQAGGYRVGVNWFHSDTFSRTQQLALLLAGANIPAGLLWKTMGGAFVPMTQTLAGQILPAAIAQESATFTAAETHRAAMEASADPTAYDFSGGWPATFQG
jgi:hypothetical protein